MKLILVLSVALGLSGQLSAQPRHWYTDKKWWIGTALMGAAIAADAHSTSRGVGMGLQERNTWAFGSHPSNCRIASVSLGYFAIQTGLHAAAWHVERNETSKPWNVLKYTALPATVLIINGHDAAKNYRLE